MCWVNRLGIYPEAIEKVFETCQNIIDDVKVYAEKLGYDDDLLPLDLNLSEAVLDTLVDSHTTVSRDVTTDVINSCLDLTLTTLENIEVCDDLGITFEIYDNGWASALSFEYNGLVSCYYNKGDMDNALKDALVSRLCDIICDRLVDNEICSDEQIADKWVEQLKDHITAAYEMSHLNDVDIAACWRREIQGTVTRSIDSFLFTQKERERQDGAGKKSNNANATQQSVNVNKSYDER